MVVSWNTVGYCTKNTSCKGFQYNLSRGLGPIYTFQFDTYASRAINFTLPWLTDWPLCLNYTCNGLLFPQYLWLYDQLQCLTLFVIYLTPHQDHLNLWRKTIWELSFLTVGVLSNLYTLHIWEKSWSSWKYQHTCARQ